MATTKTTKQVSKTTKKAAVKKTSATAKKPAKKSASKTASVAKKTALKSAVKSPAKKKATKKTAKAAIKKTASALLPIEVKARKIIHSKNPEQTEGSLGRLKSSARAFAAQAASTASVLSKEVTETATVLGTAARDKAKKSVGRSKEFIAKHPNESAGLAAAGLTMAATLIGRKGAGKLVKAAVATGLATKATKAVGKASKLLNDIRSKKK